MLDLAQRILHADAGIRRPAFADTEHLAAVGDEPRRCVGAPSIDSKIEAHFTLSLSPDPRSINRPARQRPSGKDVGRERLPSESTRREDLQLDLWPTTDLVAAMFEGQLAAAAAGGTPPSAAAAVREAAAAGALTIGLSSSAATPLLLAASHPIFLDTGAELVSGSTRMKAGTAQKIALNLLSTAIMVRLGRIYD